MADSIQRINSATQPISISSAGTTTNAPVLGLVALDTGDILASNASSASAGATLGNLLPETTEQATNNATNNNNQAILMGQTVGASLAQEGGSVNWRDFSAQAKSTLQAACYSPAEIQTYLGAVRQTYQTFIALPTPVSTAAAAAATSTAASDMSSSDLGYDGLSFDPSSSPDYDDGSSFDPSSPDGVTPTGDGVTATPGGTSTPAVVIDPSLLPSMDLPASSFTALAQQAYNSSWANGGAGVDIDELVANTQTEMDNMGYSNDQVDNYMIGLFQAYNAVAMPSASDDTPDPTPDTTTTDGTDGTGATGGTTYDPDQPEYDPLLDGDDGF